MTNLLPGIRANATRNLRHAQFTLGGTSCKAVRGSCTIAPNTRSEYDLQAICDSRKSFYGKARIREECYNASETYDEYTLYSYDTPILRVYTDCEDVTPLCAKAMLTATTRRHLKEFIARYTNCEDASIAYRDLINNWE